MRALLVLCALILSGCRFSGVAPPAPWPTGTAAPLPYRVAIAPVQVDGGIASRHARVAAMNGSAPDPELLRREAIEALRAAGVFSRVEARGRPGADPERVDAAAWDEGDDLVLELEVVDHFQEYLGHSNYVGWFVVYAAFVWPAWWVPVDHYGGGLTVRARLRGVQARAEPLLERTYQVRPDEVAQELTPSDRELAGFLDWGALWNVEASLGPANWRAIERAVAPHTRRRLWELLLADLRQRVVAPLRSERPDEREDALRRVRKRLAVVAGASTYHDDALGGGAHAADDARALGALLARPEAGGLVEGRDLHVLTDEQATRAAVLDAIAAVGSRASSSDEVVVYLAGLGSALRADDEDEAALLLHDARHDDLAGTALLLRDLGQALARLPAERLLVVLDTSFGPGPGPTRTLAGRGAALDEEGVARALALRPGRAALLAARPDQPARVLPGAQVGLFGEVLRAAIGGAADRDGDGRVTLGEVVEYTRGAVAGRAALEGFEQDPMVLGLDGGAAGLGWPR
ncbi:MAG: hypothetical protein KF878_06855 [Planctomycetes bacterium]|nr:hypothetical protein [Planctomycetota bacterium]